MDFGLTKQNCHLLSSLSAVYDISAHIFVAITVEQLVKAAVTSTVKAIRPLIDYQLDQIAILNAFITQIEQPIKMTSLS